MKKLIVLFLFSILLSDISKAQSTGQSVYLNQVNPKIDCHTVGKAYSLITPTWNTTNTDSVYYPTKDTAKSAHTFGDSIITSAYSVTLGQVNLRMGISVNDTLHDTVYVFVNRSKTPAYKAKLHKGNNSFVLAFNTYYFGTPTHIAAVTGIKGTGGATSPLVEKWFFYSIAW